MLKLIPKSHYELSHSIWTSDISHQCTMYYNAPRILRTEILQMTNICICIVNKTILSFHRYNNMFVFLTFKSRSLNGKLNTAEPCNIYFFKFKLSCQPITIDHNFKSIAI